MRNTQIGRQFAPEPLKKKVKTEIPQEILDLEKIHHEQRKAVKQCQKDEIKVIKERQQLILEIMERNHARDKKKLKLLLQRRELGLEGTPIPEKACGECAKAIGKDSDLSDYFLCKKCELYHCNEHKNGDMTTCVACNSSYCAECIKDIDKCGICTDEKLLRCCQLETMRCGDLLCSECSDSHVKWCSCPKSEWYSIDSD